MKTFELIEAYDKYIQLLSDECSDLSSMAMVHGWQSTRYKDGNRLREEISLLKMKILTQSAPITPKPTTMKNKEELKTKVFESLGTASMCWKETPTGIFDDTLAVKIGNELWAEIESFIAPSAPITHEPASSGQSAEDVLKGMYGNNTQYGYSFNSTIEAMRLHAAQVCADKDREIDARVEHWDKYYKSCLSMCSRLTDENKHLKSELDRLNESLTVMVRKNAELLKSVRPEVVVPSEKIHNEYIDDNSEWAEKNGWNACLSELRRLNPTIAFTELNHEK